MLVSTPAFVNSTKLRDSIQIVKTLLDIWDTHFTNCAGMWILHTPMVSCHFQVNRFPLISSFEPQNEVDDFDDTEGEVDADDEWADSQSSQNEDSDCDAGSDAEDSVGEDSICVESHEQQAPQVDQESMDSGHTGTNHGTDLEPRTANDHLKGGGFIHRIFGALRHGLVVEADPDNIDSDPISPFLI
ncbi:hypothetical protein B0H16DRAFT_1467088 [Mycena metata]|uniref:Uncharacterized protein n=1 Tax=Mycena metata TaxID=1033252 RepID=A0AAD7I6F2_9AGAR|nr:hypothetical protein B0H16DRAFT_1467088 [Mycena metata]